MASYIEECFACSLPIDDENIITDKKRTLCKSCTKNGSQEPNFEEIILSMALGYFMTVQNVSNVSDAILSAREIISKLPFWKSKTLPTLDAMEMTRIFSRLYKKMESVDQGTFLKEIPDFFISHFWEAIDEKISTPLAKSLEQYGHKVIYDRNSFQSKSELTIEWIKKKIKSTKHIVLILSLSFFKDEKCLIALEQIFETKEEQHIFPVWTGEITGEFLANHPIGKKILDIVGVGWNEYNGNIEVLTEKIIRYAKNAEGLKDYNGAPLLATEAEFLEQIERMLGKPIPHLTIVIESEDSNGSTSAQVIATQAQTDQEAQMEKLSHMSLEELEDYYRSQFFAMTTPEYQKQIKETIKAYTSSYGKNHPMVKQYKEWLIDKKEAEKKAKLAALYMIEYFKLQALNKDSVDKVMAITRSQKSLEEIEKEYVSYYMTMTSEEYQAQLTKTIKLGIDAFGEYDQGLVKFKSFISMNKKKAHQLAKEDCNTIKSQRDAQKSLKEMQTYQNVQREKIQLPSFGFASKDNNIIGLYLENQDLPSIPESIGQCDEIIQLNLKKNSFSKLPNSIIYLKKLQNVDFSETNLTALPKEFNISKLKSFEIKLTPMESFPPSLSELRKAWDQYKGIQEGEADFIFAVDLISGRNVPYLYEQMEFSWNSIGYKVENNSISHLSLFVFNLKAIPDLIKELKNVKSLHLWGNDLITLPKNIGELKNLEELTCVNTEKKKFNSLKFIPEEIGNLINLRTLVLKWNTLTSLPDTIGNLKNLTELDLEVNELKNLPDSIGNLSKLEKFNLKQNHLESLPETINGLTNLRNLQLNKNRLKTLPESISKMKSLKFLNLYRNEFETLPECLVNIRPLKHLTLDESTSEKFPETVKTLEKKIKKVVIKW